MTTIVSTVNNNNIAPILIEDPNDIRVNIFHNLKDAKATIRDGMFIAEGPETIRLLLNNTLDIEPKILLLKPSIFEKLSPAIENCKYKDSLKVYIMNAKLIAKLVCFNSCRGSLAAGIRPTHHNLSYCIEKMVSHSIESTTDGTTINNNKKNVIKSSSSEEEWRILAIDGSNNAANIGSMIRSASAFGINLILLSHDCCDPYYRQSIRVSVGHIFNIPTIQVVNLKDTLSMLMNEHGVSVFAAVVDKNAHLLNHQFLQTNLSSTKRWVIILGNEDKGISNEIISDDKIIKTRIDMVTGVDSLSINNACAIFLYAFVSAGTVNRKGES